MSDTKLTGAPGLTRTEIAEHLAAREAEAKPSAGAELVARWRDEWAATGEPFPGVLDRLGMAAQINAAIEQARREGAEAMRTRCFEFLVEQAETLWVLHTQRGQTDQVARIKMGALQEQADQLFALPLPGDAS